MKKLQRCKLFDIKVFTNSYLKMELTPPGSIPGGSVSQFSGTYFVKAGN